MHEMTGRPSSVTCAGPQTDHLCSAWQALRYLLVVLQESAGREALEALRPEPRALERAYTGGRVSLLVVTAAGMTPALVCRNRTCVSAPKCKLIEEHSDCAAVKPDTAPAHKGMQIRSTHNVICSLF